MRLGEATETIEAIMATPQIKKDLLLDKDQPIFRREMITYTDTNIPIKYSNNYYKADGYKYVVRLHRGVFRR